MNQITNLKDGELLKQFDSLVKQEKESTAYVVAHLSEIDRRKLFALEGYSSLFNYCVEKYHYSQSAAYRRIQAARLSASFPEIIGLLTEGRLNLETISLISSYLTQENKDKLLAQIFNKSSREIENIISYQFGKERITRDRIRLLPQIKTDKSAQIYTSGAGSKSQEESAGQETSSQKAETSDKDVSQKKTETSLEMSLSFSDTADKPKEEETRRVKIEFVAKEALAKKIERAKQILRHKYPQGKLEDIFNEALELLLEKKDPERKMTKSDRSAVILSPKDEGSSPNKKRSFGRKRPQDDMGINRFKSNSHTASRYISEKLKLEIYDRDKGQCSYISKDGKPCQEKNFLEIDHLEPFALGGKNNVENLRLLCRMHNQWRSQKTFGEGREYKTSS